MITPGIIALQHPGFDPFVPAGAALANDQPALADMETPIT
jgi:hypothetical protein